MNVGCSPRPPKTTGRGWGVLKERKKCTAKKAMLSMQVAAGHLADELGQDVLLIFDTGEKGAASGASPCKPPKAISGHFRDADTPPWRMSPRPPQPLAATLRRQPSSPRGPGSPAAPTPACLPGLPGPRGRSAEKHPHRPQASRTLRLRTLLQPELADPGPEPRFRQARAAVASGTGSPASGYGPRPPATQSRCSWARVQRHMHLLSLPHSSMTLSQSTNAGPGVH